MSGAGSSCWKEEVMKKQLDVIICLLVILIGFVFVEAGHYIR